MDFAKTFTNIFLFLEAKKVQAHLLFLLRGGLAKVKPPDDRIIVHSDKGPLHGRTPKLSSQSLWVFFFFFCLLIGKCLCIYCTMNSTYENLVCVKGVQHAKSSAFAHRQAGSGPNYYALLSTHGKTPQCSLFGLVRSPPPPAGGPTFLISCDVNLSISSQFIGIPESFLFAFGDPTRSDSMCQYCSQGHRETQTPSP